MRSCRSSAEHKRGTGDERHRAAKPRAPRNTAELKRCGELQALAEQWRQARTAMVSSTGDLKALKERFKVILLGAHRRGELHSIAADLASEVQQKAEDFQHLKERALQSLLEMKRAGGLDRLAQEMGSGVSAGRPPAKERALRSLLEMKRSGEVELLAEEMGDTQAKLEKTALELREMVMGDRQTDALKRLAGEMEQVLDGKMKTIRDKARRSLLRAHRAGELHELRGELDELADVVSTLTPKDAGTGSSSMSAAAGRATAGALAACSSGIGRGKRWSDMTTSSDSDLDPRAGQLDLRGNLASANLSRDSPDPSFSETDACASEDAGDKTS